jgi:methionine aminotransferase
VKSSITSRTRAIVVNTPHNPTGSVLSPADLEELQKVAVGHNLVIISDEVYERIIFGGKVHESVLKYPALHDRSIAVYSFGKTFHATGWKIGYAVASEKLTREIRKTHQFITFSVNTPIQWALATHLSSPENYLQLGAFYEAKRNFFLEQIKGSSFRALPCYGSYFQLLSYESISKKPDVEMANWLTQTHRVASIPVSVFHQDGTDSRILRFCFAKREETLEKAGKILAQF